MIVTLEDFTFAAKLKPTVMINNPILDASPEVFPYISYLTLLTSTNKG